MSTPPTIRKIQNNYGCERDCGSDFFQYLKYAPAQLLIAFRGGIPRFLIGDKKRYKRHHLRKTVGEEKIVRAAEHFNRLVTTEHENMSMNSELLEEVIKLARKHGNEVALVDIPIVDKYKQLISENINAYNQFISDLIEKYDIHHFNFRNSGLWPQEDFYDTHHMSLSGRTRYTQLLAERLSVFTKTSQ